MGSVMSLSCSKRKATTQDVESSSNGSCKRQKICSTKDDDYYRLVPRSFCTNGFFTRFTEVRLQQDEKDTKSSSLSSPTCFSQNWKHHVFPSFHGVDVRRNILSHILASFIRKGIDTFIDDNIDRSKSIGPELIEAIRGSKIIIVLLSKNYASSSWCLDELAEIIKCREVLGQRVMTIFYEVDPTDIKKQSGDFGKAFRKTCKGKTKEHIERWRRALEDVATIAGEHSCNWSNEAAMIEKISTDVSNKLTISMPSRDFDGYVGMRAHMEKMESLLCVDLNEARMIGIWGPPGIGKTTIARVVFNQFSSRFQLGAIMVNIKEYYPRPCLDEYNVKLQLQSQMLSQIINQKDMKISHLGVAQEWLKDKRVLLVLDEVDQLGQLDALAKEISWFGLGSRIIVTTEDRSLLNAHGINHIYKVEFPTSDEAFQIFCIHAFGEKHPNDGFYELARQVSYLAGELPLGLKVLGSALRGKSKQEWERKFPRLKTSLVRDTESIIRFSFDALCDEDKDLFLYLANFFVNESTRKVEKILANKFLDVRNGLHVLAEKSFISIDQFGKIEMHTLLIQFGRETSRKRFIHDFAKRQLLVDARDIREVLSDGTTNNRRFIGIKLHLSQMISEEPNISGKALETMSDLQFINVQSSSLHQLEISPRQQVLEGLIHYSQKIRSLIWTHFQNICLPSTFNPESLVELVLRNSNLQKLWEEKKELGNLKWMDLRFSKDLKELPDLSTATNLEELILQDCSSLVELHSSVGNLSCLLMLCLRGCSSLVEIPSSIENATSLQRLDLSNCSNLLEVPSIENATNLEQLNLDNCTSLVKLPISINATNLQELSLKNCSRIVKLPAIENVTNLKILELSNCSSLEEIPSSIGTATNLEKMEVRGCSSLVKLPSTVGYLAKLVEFHLSNCSSLVELPSTIGTATNLQKLDLRGCSSLVTLPLSIGDLVNLIELDLSNCSKLVELPFSFGNLQKLEKLRMCGCSKLEALPININLESLAILDLTNCTQLESFPRMSTNIIDLNIIGTAITEIPMSIMSWPRLSEFRISYFEGLGRFPHALGLITELMASEDRQDGGLTRLQMLRLSDSNSLVSLPQSFDSISKLITLDYIFLEDNNPWIHLNYTNCSKLNKEARDLLIHTLATTGIIVHTCFSYRDTAGGSLTVTTAADGCSKSWMFLNDESFRDGTDGRGSRFKEEEEGNGRRKIQ